jgi:hypothetical protein
MAKKYINIFQYDALNFFPKNWDRGFENRPSGKPDSPANTTEKILGKSFAKIRWIGKNIGSRYFYYLGVLEGAETKGIHVFKVVHT